MKKLYPRFIFQEIKPYLKDDWIIVIHGARQVGKTSILYLLENFVKKQGYKTLYIDLEFIQKQDILNAGVEKFNDYLLDLGFTENEIKYIFLDEIQKLKDPSNFLKLIKDHYPKIKLIVSGSSSFAIKSKFKDSLVGRTVNFEVYPLSFAEFCVFKGVHFQNKPKSNIIIKKYNELLKEFILYGAYPAVALIDNISKKETILNQIISTYIQKDIKDIANIKDIAKFNNLLQILAEQSGNLINMNEISSTVNITINTLEKYIFILENTYVIKLLRPFSRNLRTELVKMPKIFFLDTGIQQLLWLKTFPQKILGSVFETVVFTELIKKGHKNNLFYWRTKDHKEIDFIIENPKEILPIEVKTNALKIKNKNIHFFLKKYDLKNYLNIVLNKYSQKNVNYLWEI